MVGFPVKQLTYFLLKHIVFSFGKNGFNFFIFELGNLKEPTISSNSAWDNVVPAAGRADRTDRVLGDFLAGFSQWPVLRFFRVPLGQRGIVYIYIYI